MVQIHLIPLTTCCREDAGLLNGLASDETSERPKGCVMWESCKGVGLVGRNFECGQSCREEGSK